MSPNSVSLPLGRPGGVLELLLELHLFDLPLLGFFPLGAELVGELEVVALALRVDFGLDVSIKDLQIGV